LRCSWPKLPCEGRAKLDSLLEGKGIMRDEIYDYVASKL